MHKNKLVRPRPSLPDHWHKARGATPRWRGLQEPLSGTDRHPSPPCRLVLAHPAELHTAHPMPSHALTMHIYFRGRGTRLICTLTGMYLHMQMRHNLIRKWGKYANEEHLDTQKEPSWFVFLLVFSDFHRAGSQQHPLQSTNWHLPEVVSHGCLRCHFPQKRITHASKLYHSYPEAAEITADPVLKLALGFLIPLGNTQWWTPPQTHT